MDSFSWESANLINCDRLIEVLVKSFVVWSQFLCSWFEARIDLEKYILNVNETECI